MRSIPESPEIPAEGMSRAARSAKLEKRLNELRGAFHAVLAPALAPRRKNAGRKNRRIMVRRII